MKVWVKTEIDIPEPIRFKSKGTNDTVWYALYNDHVIVIKKGKLRKAKFSQQTIERLFGLKENYSRIDSSLNIKPFWNSWFDTSTGETIWKSEQIKQKEKEGMVFCTHEESVREAKKNRKYIEEKYRKEESARFEAKIMPVLKRQGII